MADENAAARKFESWTEETTRWKGDRRRCQGERKATSPDSQEILGRLPCGFGGLDLRLLARGEEGLGGVELRALALGTGGELHEIAVEGAGLGRVARLLGGARREEEAAEAVRLRL